MKLTRDELVEIFGDTIPNEAVALLLDGPDDMPIGELRDQLRAIGRKHKCIAAVREATEDIMQRMLSTIGFNDAAAISAGASVIAERAIEVALRSTGGE